MFGIFDAYIPFHAKISPIDRNIKIKRVDTRQFSGYRTLVNTTTPRGASRPAAMTIVRPSPPPTVPEPEMHGSRTETALAALGRLAEAYDGGTTRLAVGEIARDRSLQAPFLAKTLTTLAQAGILTAQRGPGGGFSLARPPEQVRIRDVVRLFESSDAETWNCLRACPEASATQVRTRIERVRAALADLLDNTTLDALRTAPRQP